MIPTAFCKVDALRPRAFAQYILPDVLRDMALDSGSCTLYGAVWGDLACAAAAIRWKGDRGVVESLFVDPDARRRGIAGGLADLALRDASGRGLGMLSLSYVLRGEELDAMDALCLRRGGKIARRAPVYRADSAAFHDSEALGPAFSPAFRPAEGIVPFPQLDAALLERLEADPEVPAFLLPSACAQRMDPALCFAAVGEGCIDAFALAGQTDSRTFTQLSVWRRRGKRRGAFRELIRAQANQCFYLCGGDFSFCCSPVSPRAAELAEEVLGGNYERFGQHSALLPVPAADI